MPQQLVISTDRLEFEQQVNYLLIEQGYKVVPGTLYVTSFPTSIPDSQRKPGLVEMESLYAVVLTRGLGLSITDSSPLNKQE